MNLSRRALAAQRPQPLREFHVAAPVGGLNTVSPASEMPPSDCLVSYNLIGSDNGLRVRTGYREWCTNVDGVSDDTVRTLLQFNGATSDDDKLFAVTSTGIYDVTASGAAPSVVLTFGTQTGNAGYGVGVISITSAGHFLLYCDEVNGYHVYTASTDTWAKVAMGGGGTQISGVDPATFVSVLVHKERVMFVQRDTANVWYLTAGSIYGAASSFPLGRQFKRGGACRNIASWTIDGGSGIDDLFVALSDGGDVVVYQGTDISSASAWGIRGVWYLGGFPAGRRIATTFGGDLLLLSLTGIVPLSQLVAGMQDRSQYFTAKIGNLFSQLANERRSLLGWSILIHPRDNALVVTVPTTAGQETEQLVMSLASRGWTRYRDLPMLCGAVWNGEFYFGTDDGRVCWATDYVDAVLLSDSDAYTPISYSLLTAYSNLESPRHKQIKFIRPILLSQTATPNVNVLARYGYSRDEATPLSDSAVLADSNSWDVAIWDTAVWGGADAGYQPLRGASGMGRDMAIAVAGKATSKTTVVGMDVMFSVGGITG